jgi:hypothetical protein
MKLIIGYIIMALGVIFVGIQFYASYKTGISANNISLLPIAIGLVMVLSAKKKEKEKIKEQARKEWENQD